MLKENMEENIVRAYYDSETITVYQAFSKEISMPAIQAQKFVSPPFKLDRMTWIKPSFLWMMHRSGWASKINQESILAIRIKRAGFNWALKNGCLSSFTEKVHSSRESWKQDLATKSVRIQWDPERDLLMQACQQRTIQIGLSGVAVERYIADWIVSIADITDQSKEISTMINNGNFEAAGKLVPEERAYPLDPEVANQINAS